MTRSFYTAVLILGLSFSLFSKDDFKLTMHINDSTINLSNIKSLETPKTKFNNPKQRLSYLRSIRSELIASGYLGAYFMHEKMDSLLLETTLYPGFQYKVAQLGPGNINEGLLSKIGFREKLYANKPFNQLEVKKLIEKILVQYEDSGYPFASVAMENISISSDTISATLHVDRKREIVIDSVIIKGDADIEYIYITKYLGLKTGDQYSEAVIKNIKPKLNELPFIKTIKPSVVRFTEDKTEIILYLEDKKASKFNGIIGFLPNSETKKLTVTGDVFLKLNNSLGKGELIEFNWRSLQPRTSDLTTKFNYPFIFKSPFGIDLNFKLYKKDTLFITTDYQLGVEYLLKGGNYFKVFWDRKKTSLLNDQDENSSDLYANTDFTVYGLGMRKEKLDYRINPRKGYSIEGEVGVGRRKEKALINGDEDPKPNTQFKTKGNLHVFIPIKARSTIMMRINGAYLSSDKNYDNEMFRIGGLKTFRGFDEETILASSYAIFSLEYRILLEQNSNVYLFTDVGWFEYKSVNKEFRDDIPYGFGAGMNFQTKAGIFSVNYALGAQLNNPILFKSAKLHFGIINYF
ncbi:MAG: hypothetical protein HRT71_06780 [Flavobacteriales bacterium]|nr:hypothetical protein [Flavobacteriales bacterium]